MTNPHLRTAFALLDSFESRGTLLPVEAEALVTAIFQAGGHEIIETGFVGDRGRADCMVQARVEGRSQLIAVEVKSGARPGDALSVDQAMSFLATGRVDRTMVISRFGFSRDALARADGLGAGRIDLFGPGDLRNWLSKHSGRDGIDATAVNIIREAMRKVALRMALHPEELITMEWRQLEQLLREVFEGLGFGTTLTRPGRDGGFDLELEIGTPAGARIHLVEVKHWTEQRPGAAHLTKLVKVTTERKASGALLLSTSGFAGTIYSGLLEFSAPVRLGDGNKVIALCKAFHRLSTGFWLADTDLESVLYAGTTPLGG